MANQSKVVTPEVVDQARSNSFEVEYDFDAIFAFNSVLVMVACCK
jgi:hypothetical protein